MDKESFLNQCRNFGLVITPVSSPMGERFLIENYFFDQVDTSTELSLIDEQWEVKSFKGYFVKINSPEELITHNYFEYYLPLKKQKNDWPLPSMWQDLFETAGLLEKDSVIFKEARRATLLKKLEEHFYLEQGIKDLEFWQWLSREFPECVYIGPAYRAVLSHPDQLKIKKVSEPGYSWALSMDGIKDFIHVGDSYNLKEDNGFILFSGIVQGISLIHILKFLGEDYKNITGQHPSFSSEEEVIALEVLSHDEGTFLKSKDVK